MMYILTAVRIANVAFTRSLMSWPNGIVLHIESTLDFACHLFYEGSEIISSMKLYLVSSAVFLFVNRGHFMHAKFAMS